MSMDESPRVLGVDDSLTIRKALELVLKPAGYNLELAASGAEAVEKARGFHPAVLLLDFILPDMAGTEVCKRLASDPETADIPIVLVSAKGAEIRQAYQDVRNVVSYITKPFTPDVVTGVVADVLEQLRAGTLTMEKVPPAEAPVVPEEAEAVAAAPEPVAQEIAPEAVEPWEEAEELYEPLAPVSDATAERARRDSLEMMFETLRAGLEGVYVEEVETRAAGDTPRAYTELASQLAERFSETLLQARSGVRFALNKDGSLRSLDEALLAAFRRVCRLLFRAVSDGAVESEESGGSVRLLLVCSGESALRETFETIRAESSGWNVLIVAERFRQLPLLTRLYGPTHLIVEASRGGAISDQVKLIHSMPESRRLQVLGLTSPGGPASADVDWKELGIETWLEDGPGLAAAVLDHVTSSRVSHRAPEGGATDDSSGVAVAGVP